MEGSSDVWREVAKRIVGVVPGGITGGGGQGLSPSGAPSLQLEAAVLGAWLSRVEVRSAQSGGTGGEDSCL